MFCSQCGEVLQNGNRCHKCGNETKIEKNSWRESGWRTDPEMEELLRELHMQELLDEPEMPSPAETEQSQPEPLQVNEVSPPQAPAHTVVSEPPHPVAEPAKPPEKQKNHQKLFVAVTAVLVVGAFISGMLVCAKLKKSEDSDKLIDQDVQIETTTEIPPSEIPAVVVETTDIAATAVTTTTTTTTITTATTDTAVTTVTVTTDTTTETDLATETNETKIKKFGQKQVIEELNDTEDFTEEDFNRIQEDVSDPKVERFEEFMEKHIQEDGLSDSPTDIVDFSQFNYDDNDEDENKDDADYENDEIDDEIDSDEEQETNSFTWDGKLYTLKYQRNSSTKGHQYQLLESNQLNPAGFLYAIEEYRNSYNILICLNGKTYIGCLRSDNQFYSVK